MEDFGIVKINSLETLIKEIKIMLPYTTVSLVGPSGTGKTTLVENLKNDPDLGIDKFVILRLQGLTSEDFRIPILDTVTTIIDGKEKVEKVVEFANIGIFKEIIDNPEKKYALFFDEITRAERNVTPLLFSILEGKLLDGIKRNNVMVITAFNFGGEYESNIDFADDALRRRQVFYEYIPSKEDFLNFIAENNYHEIIQEVALISEKDTIINHVTNKELMQPTTFGSWDLLNKRWKRIEELEKKQLSYEECKIDILQRGDLLFNFHSKEEILSKLILLEEMNTIDFQKEIIDKNGLKNEITIYKKNGEIYDKRGKEKELLIKTLNFIKKNVIKSDDYLEKNANKIIEIFNEEVTLLVSLIKQIENLIKKNYSQEQAILDNKNRAIFGQFMKALIEKGKQDPEFNAKFIDFKKIWTFMNSSTS